MNIKIKEDATTLLEYYTTYNLSNVLDNDDFKNEFTGIHKRLYAYLVFVMELKHQNADKRIIDEKPMAYLEESVSDVLQAFFAWTNGAYKAANLLLRSTIENFIKAFIGIQNQMVFTEKNVYSIFDMAENMDAFDLLIGKETLGKVLHRIYGELCKFTHTATVDNMDSITAMRALPKRDNKKANDFYSIVIKLMDAYLGFFLANYKNVINDMHRINKDIFYEVIPKSIINSIEAKRFYQ